MKGQKPEWTNHKLKMGYVYHKGKGVKLSKHESSAAPETQFEYSQIVCGNVLFGG